MEQQSFAVSSSTGRGVGPLTHVGGPQNCGQADESPHPSILLVGAGSIATATRKCLARGGLGEDWGRTGARYYLHVDHMLVLNAGFILIANVTSEFPEEKLSKSRRSLEMEMFATC